MADLRPVDAVVRELLGPLLALEEPSRTGWQLVGWDAEQGITLTLGKPPSLLLVELERRDDARDCYARTARFNICVRHQFQAGEPLDDLERRVVDQLVSVVRSREGLLPDVERPGAMRQAEVREIEVDRVLVPEGAGHYYVNPYVGCMIGCDFCYAADRADFSRELEGLPRLPWGRWVDVKVNAPEVLAREVGRHKPGIVRLSPIITDPYQPLERRFRVTRRCLEVLRDAGYTPVVLTRAARVVDDLDVLAACRKAAVGLSIPTDDDGVRQRFEPGGDPIDERIDALERCHRAGIATFAVIQPMLPMDPERLVARLAPLVRAVRIDRMYEMPRVLPLYEQAGRLDAAEDRFFRETEQVLRAGFRRHGIAMDDLDDLGTALGLGS